MPDGALQKLFLDIRQPLLRRHIPGRKALVSLLICLLILRDRRVFLNTPFAYR